MKFELILNESVIPWMLVWQLVPMYRRIKKQKLLMPGMNCMPLILSILDCGIVLVFFCLLFRTAVGTCFAHTALDYAFQVKISTFCSVQVSLITFLFFQINQLQTTRRFEVLDSVRV